MAVADSGGCFEPLAHVAQPNVKIACIDPAMPHHDPVGYSDSCQAVRVAEIDAAAEIPEGRGHATIHVLRIGKAAQRARLTFRRVGTA